ncbi:hypothetical protein HRI_001098600 [Hibiscus trionum]|uniref:C2H2-type domain-containing protein n=1 Tax=Hibiscus trionum TaxID=183268 RepID=A0A9W7HBL6_HIBTR|nr:hypothetical protein HRI_001098600 [Hibiscus trionum]
MDDQVTNTMGKESVSAETSDSAPFKPNKLTVKLKISKKISYGGGDGGGGGGDSQQQQQQHICPVCSKGFTSGKALGGHIRIHMKGNKASRHRKISKRQPRNNVLRHRSKSKQKISNTASPDDDLNQDGDEKVSCCICNKEFKSLKSLFGHMRNHPERNWRGIRPPPSDKNSCCSSVSENDEALEVDQVKGSNSDLLKSLPKWKANSSKTLKKSDSDNDDEIPEAAYCLMKLSRASIPKNRSFNRFHKTPLKLEQDKADQNSSSYPRNPRGQPLLKAADHKSSKVCSSKALLDFDLNKPYVP